MTKNADPVSWPTTTTPTMEAIRPKWSRSTRPMRSAKLGRLIKNFRQWLNERKCRKEGHRWGSWSRPGLCWSWANDGYWEYRAKHKRCERCDAYKEKMTRKPWLIDRDGSRGFGNMMLRLKDHLDAKNAAI